VLRFAALHDTEFASPLYRKSAHPMMTVAAARHSKLIEPFVPRLTNGKARQQIKHRRGQARGPRKRRRRAHQRIDFHGPAEFVVLQDRRLVLRQVRFG